VIRNPNIFCIIFVILIVMGYNKSGGKKPCRISLHDKAEVKETPAAVNQDLNRNYFILLWIKK